MKETLRKIAESYSSQESSFDNNEGNYAVYTDDYISLIHAGIDKWNNCGAITVAKGNVFDISCEIAKMLESYALEYLTEHETLTAVYEIKIKIGQTDVLCVIETSHTCIESLSLSYFIDGNEVCFEDDYVFIVKMCEEYLRDVYNSWKSDNYLAFNSNKVDDSCKY